MYVIYTLTIPLLLLTVEKIERKNSNFVVLLLFHNV